jgi:hypothetical protein
MTTSNKRVSTLATSMQKRIAVAPVVAMAICLALVSNASAARVPPSKASRLVDVGSSPGSSLCRLNFGRALDVRSNSDATNEPFIIPKNRVFVITAIEISVSFGLAPGHSFEVELERVTDSTASSVTSVTGTADSTGAVRTIQLTFPTGVSVKSGVTLCAAGIDTTTITGTFIPVISAHGFFADDD